MAFIVFEGIDASGKSTLLELLSQKLSQELSQKSKDTGALVLKTKEPGGTHIGGQIRQMLLDKGHSQLDSVSETLLYYADRKQHVEEFIKPNLKKGHWILSDRYWASTSAYQCGGRGIDEEFVKILRNQVCQNCEPDLWILLDLEVELSLKRLLAKSNGPRDRLESEPLAFHQRVRDYYLKLSREEPERWLVLDASQSPQDLLQQIWHKLQSKKRI